MGASVYAVTPTYRGLLPGVTHAFIYATEEAATAAAQQLCELNNGHPFTVYEAITGVEKTIVEREEVIVLPI